MDEASSCYCDFVSTCTLSSSSAIYVGLGIHIPSSVPELKDASPGVRFAMASFYIYLDDNSSPRTMKSIHRSSKRRDLNPENRTGHNLLRDPAYWLELQASRHPIVVRSAAGPLVARKAAAEPHLVP
jgi:hypothetical protein